ncbi:MAG TPA: hypothetical protein VKE51_20300 [Vicinamibacterales bacterium]|nr:hypothetical protein [Vicinamibacterales bacterium]
MKSDDRTAPEERLTTADIAQGIEDKHAQRESAERRREEDVRGHREETITNKDAAVAAERGGAASGVNPVRGEPTITSDQSRQVGRERQPQNGLFDHDESRRLRERWTHLQGSFVDEPRRAVKEADAFVAEVMKPIADVFASERTGLERQWDRGDKVTTEDLRVALQRYHAFFDRLLSV